MIVDHPLRSIFDGLKRAIDERVSEFEFYLSELSIIIIHLKLKS